MHGIAGGLLIMASGWAVLTVMGAAVVANLPAPTRRELAPATPVIGAMVVAIACATLCWVLPVSVFAVPLLLVGAAACCLGLARQRRGPSMAEPLWARQSVRSAIVTGLAGLVPAALASLPAARLGTYIASQPTLSNDAFYYVSVSDWLISRTTSGTPVVAVSGADSYTPGYGPAVSSLTLGLRFSQEGVQAFLTMLTTQSPTQTWYPITVLWLALIPASVCSSFALLRLSRRAGLGAGVILAVSGAVLTQMYNQNSASLLGICFAPLALASLVRLLRPLRSDPSWSKWVYAGVAALAWASVVSVYNELLPLTAAACGLYAVARLIAAWRTVALPFAMFVIGTIALSPIAATQFLRQLRYAREQGAGVGANFYPLDAPVISTARVLGLRTYYEIGVPLWAWLIFMAVGVGFAFAVRYAPERLLYLSLPLNIAVITFQLYRGDRWYSQQRAVEVGTPIILFAVLVGWGYWLQAAQGRTAPARCTAVDPSTTVTNWTAMKASPAPISVMWPARIRAVVALAVGAAVALCCVQGPLRLSRSADLNHRHVDGTFAQVRGWVDARSDNGTGVVVNVVDYFDQLWVAYELRRREDVGYVTLFPDYLRVHSFAVSGSPRWAILDLSHGQLLSGTPGCESIQQNPRFMLVDAQTCPAALAP